MATSASKAKVSADTSKDEDLIEEATEAYERAAEAESENRRTFLEDTQFARLPEQYQWPEAVRKQRTTDGRPCLTINKLAPLIRQVVNDSRQNKPSIKVHPADDGADPDTAEIYNGLIRNIEYTSDADVAYDTAVDNAVTGGFGYFRINTRYTSDDSFDQDLAFERVVNPLSIFGDPDSTAADSSDWNVAFVTTALAKKRFEAKYKGAEKVDWDTSGYARLITPWMDDGKVVIAEYWTRDEVKRQILALSNGEIIPADEYKENKAFFDQLGLEIVGNPRDVSSHKVTQRIMTGAEVLETNEWGGRYIPIVPVYGDEVNIEGKRYLLSLIGGAKDAQRMFNYWRTTSTELVAMAPKAPWVGAVGSFATDIDKWANANTESLPYIEYDIVVGAAPPTRQPFSGVPAGALQEALNASDDIKTAVGLYDASVGARSNETSGRAILARQREGDVSTFHFIDNLARAIRHGGRILIDLIPKVYSAPRVLRILGQDGTPQTVQVNQPFQQQKQGPDGQIQNIERIYQLDAGKYDLTVSTGPSYTTKREEAAAQMIDLIRAYPEAAPLIGDLLAKNLDWPGADEIAKRLQAMLPPQTQGQNPETQQLQQQLQTLHQALQQAGQKLQGVEADKTIEHRRLDIEDRKVDIDAQNAETNRLKALVPKGVVVTADQVQGLVLDTIQQLLNSPDLLKGGGDGGSAPPAPPPLGPLGQMSQPADPMMGQPLQAPQNPNAFAEAFNDGLPPDGSLAP